jgi:hypothetical protein
MAQSPHVTMLERPFQLLRRAAPDRLLWLGAPILLYCWTVTGPFIPDDLNLILRAERFIRGECEHLDLFRFAPTDEAWRELRDRGTYPWWMPDTGRADLFRPLAGLSFYVDVRLFGRNPLGHRLVSLLWFALALICVRRLFLVACKDEVRAGAATFFFGISQTVTAPVTWVCSRGDLLVVVGTALSAGAYLASFTRPRWSLVSLSAAGFAFALLSKSEVAVAFAGVICAHEILLRWRRSVRPGGRIRAAIAVVIFAMALGFLVYYLSSRPQSLGFSDARAGRVAFNAGMPLTLLLNLSVWTLGFPATVLQLASSKLLPAVLAAAAAIAVTTIAYYLSKALHRDVAAPFFLLWVAMFLLPGPIVATATRTLCLATIGWTYLLARMILPSENARPAVPAVLRHWLFFTNGIVSICCAIGAVLFMRHAESQNRAAIRHYIASMDSPPSSGDAIIIAQPRSATEMLGIGERLEYLHGLTDVAYAVLTGPGTHAHVRREDDHTLVITANASSLMDTPLHRATLGHDWKPAVGMKRHLREFTAEITRLDDHGGVAEMRLRFNRPLSSPHLRFYPPHLAAVARGQLPLIPSGRTIAPRGPG